ncbi:unnamed protein product [Anisakis simplex]|uniref:Ski_Sno domain-containing protein n=1 Tax=Anisakis simplex TaxID=6269 RepID=A0A0M3JWI6_ANISI|nr:unnamed protein product [Anisakis simplex]
MLTARDASPSSTIHSSRVAIESIHFDSTEAQTVKLYEYRGKRVAGFEVFGRQMICLPQLYEIFLKNLVGGLHTVYTKLKRLEIRPVVCSVEQRKIHANPTEMVRALRSLGAIQPGVNRCKLISSADFDRLYGDCHSSCSRPGRPAKRYSLEALSSEVAKREKIENKTFDPECTKSIGEWNSNNDSNSDVVNREDESTATSSLANATSRSHDRFNTTSSPPPPRGCAVLALNFV